MLRIFPGGKPIKIHGAWLVAAEPPKKRFKHLQRVSELKELEDEDADSQELTNEEKEIERYSGSKPNTEELQLDPIIY